MVFIIYRGFLFLINDPTCGSDFEKTCKRSICIVKYVVHYFYQEKTIIEYVSNKQYILIDIKPQFK